MPAVLSVSRFPHQHTDEISDKMENKKYHTVGTIPKSKSQKEAKSIPLTHKYMTGHFPGLVYIQTLKINKKWD